MGEEGELNTGNTAIAVSLALLGSALCARVVAAGGASGPVRHPRLAKFLHGR